MRRLMGVADNALVVHAIRLALRQTSGFQVVGFLDGRRPIMGALLELEPDVVVVDDMQQPDDALERLREIAEHAPEAQSILLTLQMEEDWLEQAFDAGATTVLSKTVHPVALGTLMRETARANVVHRPRKPKAAEFESPLTSREAEILALASRGHTNGQIARELWITEQTVKFHLSNTYRKLGVNNRTEATRFAYLHALVPAAETVPS